MDGYTIPTPVITKTNFLSMHFNSDFDNTAMPDNTKASWALTFTVIYPSSSVSSTTPSSDTTTSTTASTPVEETTTPIETTTTDVSTTTTTRAPITSVSCVSSKLSFFLFF